MGLIMILMESQPLAKSTEVPVPLYSLLSHLRTLGNLSHAAKLLVCKKREG